MRHSLSALALFATFFVSACSTTSRNDSLPPPATGTPLEEVEIAQKEIAAGKDPSDVSYEMKRINAAMYLLSQARTELQAGNSGLAVKHLALARKYNPWHDDIKDLYVVAVRMFTQVTRKMAESESCDVMIERLRFLNDVSPDSLASVSDISKKCGFDPAAQKTALSEQSLRTIPLPQTSEQIEKQVAGNLIDELDSILKRNTHIPIREVLIYGLNYYSRLYLHTKALTIDPNATDDKEFDLIFTATAESEKETSSEAYCESIQNFVRLEPVQEETLRKLGSGQTLSCRTFNFWTGEKRVDVVTTRKIAHGVDVVWPLPKRVVVKFTLTYQSGRSESLYNVMELNPDPVEIQMAHGFSFKYISGDLPIELRNARYGGFQDGENVLSIKASRKVVSGLASIRMEIDPHMTLKVYDAAFKQNEQKSKPGQRTEEVSMDEN